MVEFEPLAIVGSLAGLVLIGLAWVVWGIARWRQTKARPYVAVGLFVLGFGLVVVPPLIILAALG